ncbi:putative hydrolase (HAD superfamily) [Methanocella arvoryzae MRE50]|uniref:Hydrolase (HAD superfamily) n=1 Tax=Methanocella arvoryzae (strain DSM 22066 / NBRC 105507 / MRE50) TaxID=351160 RepID=Q0W3I7_METAR|nr:putative hydrolase (HAD superfamily) [Methanocella arvoryzae MRE50]
MLSDYDRTFTDSSLRVEPGLVDAIIRLKRKGTLFSIVSGRKYSFMYDLYQSMGGVVDSFIAENGCVGYANGRKHYIARSEGREEMLVGLRSLDVPYDAGDVVVSVSVDYEREVDQVIKGYQNMHVVRNVDSLMILPHSVSKATGIQWLMGVYNLTPVQMACIGDAENDLEMRSLCSLMGAVCNALPAVKKESDYVCRQSFGFGLKEFLEYIETRAIKTIE